MAETVSPFRPIGGSAGRLSSPRLPQDALATVEWRQEPQRELAIREFFRSLGIAPSQDYLAGNGGVADAPRILEYPVTGSTAEVTELTKRILKELCGVSPTEALNIGYEEN